MINITTNKDGYIIETNDVRVLTAISSGLQSRIDNAEHFIEHGLVIDKDELRIEIEELKELLRQMEWKN